MTTDDSSTNARDPDEPNPQPGPQDRGGHGGMATRKQEKRVHDQHHGGSHRSVDEATIAHGVRFALERMQQLLEPAGAAALGAVLAGLIPIADGELVCVVASGGNVDLDRLPEILALDPTGQTAPHS